MMGDGTSTGATQKGLGVKSTFFKLLRCFYEGFEDRVTLSVILMLVTFLSLGLLTLGQLFTCSLKHEAEATEI